MRRSVMVFAGASAPFVALALGLSVAGCPLVAFPVPDPDPAHDAGVDAPAAECAAAIDCDDGNPCTDESCASGACSSTLAAEGTDCADADRCNGVEACNALGQCASGAPVVVDDGDACTADACDAATGAATHTALPSCGWTQTSAASAPSPRQRHTAVWTGSRMIVWGGSVSGAPSVTATGGVYDPVADTWTPTSSTNAPPARHSHRAVWTGSKMIVWGGSVSGAPGITATGGVYDPLADTWTPTSPTNAPPARHSHRAVWTGSKMIVWGGFGAASYESTGGIYDPATDTWTSMSTAGAPAGRTELAMVWAGSSLLVWGGFNGSALADGAAYDPAKDMWSALPIAGAPGPRLGHSGVWTGARAIFWGGSDLFDWHKDGALVTPGSPSAWSGSTDVAGAPGPREGHTALWTGKEMLIWGGWNGGPYLDDGGALDPASDADGAWSAITTTGAPSPRTEHAAVWTDKAMMVWGGCGGDACVNALGDGGVWTPGAGGGSWRAVAAVPAITPRQRHTAVWTGKEVILWGGKAKSGITATGARFVP